MTIDAPYFWTAMVLMAVGTFAIRISIIAMSDRLVITPRVRELFGFIPAAIFPALVVPMVFFHQGHVTWLMGKERLAISVLAVFVSLWTKNMIATLGFGLVALYLLTSTF